VLVLVICVLVFTVFCIVCTVSFVYRLVFVYVFLLVLSALPPSDISTAISNNNNNNIIDAIQLNVARNKVNDYFPASLRVTQNLHEANQCNANVYTFKIKQQIQVTAKSVYLPVHRWARCGR
jgi:hypothetical protein